MFIYPLKNSYLQSVSAVNPSVVNKAVDQAMQRVSLDTAPQGPAQLLESMQPSLYCPHVDITRSSLGFGRVGLRILNRDLHSPDPLIQLQALHSVMDQVQISENALFLINLNVVHRLVDLMKHPNSIIREKVCMTYAHLANYYQGRNHIMAQPLIIENLMWLIMRDVKEIRYAAACTLSKLATNRRMLEVLLKNNTIIENLLKMVKDDYSATVTLHLRTLENLTACQPERALKSNCFCIMRKLFHFEDEQVVCAAMDVMAQLCKHEVGRHLADVHDLTRKLRKFLFNHSIEIITSALGILAYTTLSNPAQWRASGLSNEMTKRLISLCYSPNKPQLQLKCMQVLINLCSCPDIREYLRCHWLPQIRAIRVRAPKQWDGTSESTCGLETGHNYRTVYVKNVETIKDDGDETEALNVHNYLRRLREVKSNLIKIIKSKSNKKFPAVTFQ